MHEFLYARWYFGKQDLQKKNNNKQTKPQTP